MSITIYELAAIATALVWAVTGLISPLPAGHLGAVAFTRWRMTIMFLIMAAFVTLTGRWDGIPAQHYDAVLLSGFIGIFIGDTLLFATMNMIGPRRTMILFSLNAPISAILGLFFLKEALSLLQGAGVFITFMGVALAIAFGKRRDQLHVWEQIKGPLWLGLGLGVLAATGQSIGSLIARPVMAAGADPILVSCLRVGISALLFQAILILPTKSIRAKNPMNKRILFWCVASGVLGMVVGMTLLLYALSGGKVGIVSTLSATTPALALPLIWLKTGERPALFAWVGAGIVVIGNALLFT